MAKIVPISKPVSPYISLEELTQIRPYEADVTFEGHTFKVRGLTSGQVSTIIAMSRNLKIDGGVDQETDRALTVCFGLVQPDVKAHADLEAARIIVDGMLPMCCMALATKIRELTWGQMQTDATDGGVMAEPEAESEPAG
jgi:hypothetical protein